MTGIGDGIKVNVTGIRIGIGIIEFAKHWIRNWNWNRNHMMLESELESKSKFLGSTGIGIRIGITCYWSWNWNRNLRFRKTLELESESQSSPCGIGIGITGPGIIYNSELGPASSCSQFPDKTKTFENPCLIMVK